VLTQEEIHKIAAVESSHWWYRGMREIFFSMLAPYLAKRGALRILDVGCGTGGNLLELSAFGTARGIDVDPLCVEYCRKRGLNCTVADMLAMQEPAASADLVTLFDVLTQAESKDTERILSGIANVLAPNGLLAFRETAMPIAAGAHDRAVGILQRFTKPELVSMLRRTGFEPLRVSYVNTLLFPPIVLARRLQDALNPNHAESDVRPTTPLLNATLLGVLRIEKALLRYADLPFGVSIFGVARKQG
jgi:SAM-dependent methyltransferase